MTIVSTISATLNSVHVAGLDLIADLSGALFWAEEGLLVVSDLHLEKGSSFAIRRVLLPPYDTVATLAKLRAVIALGDSFHDREAHQRLDIANRATLTHLQTGRVWIWISGNHDPALPPEIDGTVANDMRVRPLTFRHEPTGAQGEIAGHLHPKARVSNRGRSIERRCFASDGLRAVMPSFGAYTGGLSIHDQAFKTIFQTSAFIAHLLGDRQVHRISAARCC